MIIPTNPTIILPIHLSVELPNEDKPKPYKIKPREPTDITIIAKKSLGLKPFLKFLFDFIY